MINRYDYIITNEKTGEVKVVNTIKKVGRFLNMPTYVLSDETTFAIYNQLGINGRVTGLWTGYYRDYKVQRAKPGTGRFAKKEDNKPSEFATLILDMYKDGDITDKGVSKLLARYK